MTRIATRELSTAMIPRRSDPKAQYVPPVAPEGRKTDGRGIAAFFGLALLGISAAAVVVRLFTDSLSPLTSTFVIALAMPMPFAAAVIVNREAPRRAVSGAFRRAATRPELSILPPMVAILTWFASALASAWLVGDVVGVDSAGGVTTTATGMRANLAILLDPKTAAEVQLPSFFVVVLLGLMGGIIAGFTLNGVLAFGEEYGWRGFLWERLDGRGPVGTIGIVGVLWGLWHAPVILLVGHNYPDDRLVGVLWMVLFSVAMSWPMHELRRQSGSPIAPAALHGALNAVAGIVLIVCGGDRLVAPPLGILGALAWLPAGAVLRMIGPRFARA